MVALNDEPLVKTADLFFVNLITDVCMLKQTCFMLFDSKIMFMKVFLRRRSSICLLNQYTTLHENTLSPALLD